MRGIVLAGGSGTRLAALTKVMNKHLLPVGGRPMIEWPIKVLRDNNIHDITIVSSPRGVGQLAEQLGGGYTYRVQDKPGGIAEAILCADGKNYERVVVILGDNIFSPAPEIAGMCPHSIVGAAHCYLAKVPSELLPEFGVAKFKSKIEDKISYIEEKPSKPPSEYVVTGLYVFGPDVFERIKELQPSKRGELEVTDLLNWYATNEKLTHTVYKGFWGDAGTNIGMWRCLHHFGVLRGTQ